MAASTPTPAGAVFGIWQQKIRTCNFWHVRCVWSMTALAEANDKRQKASMLAGRTSASARTARLLRAWARSVPPCQVPVHVLFRRQIHVPQVARRPKKTLHPLPPSHPIHPSNSRHFFSPHTHRPSSLHPVLPHFSPPPANHPSAPPSSSLSFSLYSLIVEKHTLLPCLLALTSLFLLEISSPLVESLIPHQPPSSSPAASLLIRVFIKASSLAAHLRPFSSWLNS
jgi:hypothetical protein